MLSLKQAQLFLSLSSKEQRARIATLSPEELLSFDGWFEFWAHRGQLPPLGESWRVWLMMAGRGFGKTRAGAEWVHRLALSRPVRIALVGATIEEARAVMVEGVSGVLIVARLQRQRVKWEPSLGADHLDGRKRRQAVFRRQCGRIAWAGAPFRLVRRARQMAPGGERLG